MHDACHTIASILKEPGSYDGAVNCFIISETLLTSQGVYRYPVTSLAGYLVFCGV